MNGALKIKGITSNNSSERREKLKRNSQIDILYVEDSISFREQLRIALEREGFAVRTASNGLEGLNQFKQKSPDLIISDYRMPEMNGIKMIQEIHKIDSEVPVIITTAFQERDSSIELLKIDADKYLPKPVDIKILFDRIYRILEQKQREQKISNLNQKIQNTYNFLLGKSTLMQYLIRDIQKVVDTNQIILIEGESGVGKSHLARLLHNMSNRSNAPFITVNTGAFQSSMVERVLFGSLGKSKGAFEEASGGTLFLDDVQNLSTQIQEKILDIIETRLLQPPGRKTPIELDVRLIIVVSKSIGHTTLQDQGFRSWIFNSLEGYNITIPPLRKRKEDIRYFADMILMEISSDRKFTPKRLSNSSYRYLEQHPLNNNFRDLAQMIRVGVAMSKGNVITPFAMGDEEYDELVDEELPEETPQIIKPSVMDVQVVVREDGYVIRTETLDVNTILKAIMNKAVDITSGNLEQALKLLNLRGK